MIGVISGGKPTFEDIIEYKFGNVQEYDIPSPSLSPVIEGDSSSPQNALPDYIPSYFPPFPEIKEDTVMDEVDRMLLQKQQQLEEQKIQQQQKQQQQQQQASSLPLPVIVKNRKKPIENPFTHIIPFEESSLASENQQQQQLPQPKPLSLLLKVGNKRSEVEEQESARKRRKAAITPLTEALQSMKDKPEYKLGEGLAGRDELFKAQTQNAAAPGNYLFNHDSGVFDELVRNVAEPLVISKLTAPNLLIDIHTTTSNTPAPVTPALFEYGSPGSMPTSPDGGKLSRTASMLAVLAGGASSKKAGLKQLNKLAKTKPISASPFNSNHTISKHSVDINAIKTGDSKYIIKKKRMLAERQQALERQKLLEQQMKDNPNGLPSTTATPITTTNAVTDATVSSTSLPVQPSQPHSLLQHQFQSQQKATLPHSTSVAAAPLTSFMPTKPMQNTGPISLSSFSSGNATTAAEKEKKLKHKKTPKLMLNFSQNPLPAYSPTEDAAVSSPSTPKIRFKIKPPEQSPKKQTEPVPIKLEKQQFQSSPIPQRPVQQPPKHSSMNNGFTTTEEIRCICENPTVDYGTFMIACDRCGVWFHGSCVGIAESDQVEEWYCRRCRIR
jgi:hypothetical protein